MTDLHERFAETCARHGWLAGSATVVAAVSGGPDSVVLLDLLQHRMALVGGGVAVAHLDHGWRPEGVDDAAFVAGLAAERGLEVVLGARDTAAVAAQRGLSPEDAARQVRYAFLWAAAARAGADVVVTAHHADDQAETVLLNVVRGSGLAGLAGMRAESRLPVAASDVPSLIAGIGLAPPAPDATPPRLLRPLLGFTKDELAEHARAHGLESRPDASNLDRRFARNQLRAEVLPALERLNPRVREALTRLADAARSDNEYLEAEARSALRPVAAADGSTRLDCVALLALHPALQGRVVRLAAVAAGADARALGPDHVASVLAVAASGRVVVVPGAVHVHRADGALVFAPALGPPPLALPTAPRALVVPGRTALPGGWSIHAAVRHRAPEDPDRAPGPWRVQADADVVPELAARRRRPGEEMQPLGMAGRSKSLQDLFVDAHIPAVEREAWPIVVTGDRVVWVPGLRLDERARVRTETRRILELAVDAPDGARAAVGP